MKKKASRKSRERKRSETADGIVKKLAQEDKEGGRISNFTMKLVYSVGVSRKMIAS